jgi:hypothetical protein
VKFDPEHQVPNQQVAHLDLVPNQARNKFLIIITIIIITIIIIVAS